MEILLNGSTIISRTGSCQSQMKRKWVNLAAYIGQIATVKLVDAGVADWGHILFDDFRYEAACEGINYVNLNNLFTVM